MKWTKLKNLHKVKEIQEWIIFMVEKEEKNKLPKSLCAAVSELVSFIDEQDYKRK